MRVEMEVGSDFSLLPKKLSEEKNGFPQIPNGPNKEIKISYENYLTCALHFTNSNMYIHNDINGGNVRLQAYSI